MFLLQDTVSVSLGRFDKTFSEEHELKLKAHIVKFDQMFFGLRRQEVKRLAYKYAEIHNLDHRFNIEEKQAGNKWLNQFCKRHRLSPRTPEKCSAARASGFNRVAVGRFYNNLRNVMKNMSFLRVVFSIWTKVVSVALLINYRR